MKIETVKRYSNTKFRRITGIKRATFELMVKILSVAYAFKHEKGGRNTSLTIEEMLLSALEYWREYRSYAHIAASYGIDESNIYRTIKWVEEILIKCGKFSLPGKRTLKKEVKKYKVILIDATENPIERPKKNRKNIIQASKNVIQ